MAYLAESAINQAVEAVIGLMNSTNPKHFWTREDRHFRGQTSGMLQQLLRVALCGQNQRNDYERLFAKNNIRGVIYTGGNDGLCLVSYDFSQILPIALYNPFTKQFETKGDIIYCRNGSPKDSGMDFTIDPTLTLHGAGLLAKGFLDK